MMKRIFQGIGILVLVLLAASAAVFLMRDALIERTAIRTVRDRTGLDITCEGIRTTVFPLSVRLTGLEVKNPAGFEDEDEDALRIDEFFIAVDRRTLLADEVRLPEARLRVPRLVVVQREDGRTNLEQLGRDVRRARRPRPDEVPPAADPGPDEPPLPDRVPHPDRPPHEAAPARARRFHIDRLVTYVGEVEIREYRPDADAPRIRRVRLDREMVFENVTDLQPVLRQWVAQLAVSSIPHLLEEVQERAASGESLREIGDSLREKSREWRRALRESGG